MHTDKFCFIRKLASWESIVSPLLGFAGTAMLILYWYSKPTLHYWKNIDVKLLKPLSLLGNTKKFALNKSSPAEVFWDLKLQGGSNMTGTDLYVNNLHCAAAVRP